MLPFIRASVLTVCLAGTGGWLVGATCVAQEQPAPVEVGPDAGTEPRPAPVRTDGVAEPAPEVQATVPRYLQWRQAQFVDWLSDGSLLIRTRFGEAEQVHRVHAPLGMREQVSFAPNGISMAMAQPYANDTLIYLEQQQGGQRARWYLQHMDTHELVPVTDGQHRDGAGVWSHDGRHLAFVSQRVNGIDSEVYEIDTSLPAPVPRLLAGGAGYRWRIFDRSADDRRLLLGRTASSGGNGGGGNGGGGNADAVEVESRTADLYELQTDNGDLSPVGAAAKSSRPAPRTTRGRLGKSALKAHVGSAATVQVRAARYAPDGHGLVLLTDQSAPGDTGSGPHFEHLVYLDPDDSQWRTLAAPTGHDVVRFDLSADGRYIAYSVRAEGTDRLMVLDQTRKLDLAISELPAGTIGPFKFDASGEHLGVGVESVRAPGDVYVYDVATHSVTAWTHSEAGPLDTQGFVLPERVAFPTWDRQQAGRWQQLQSQVYRAGAPAIPDAGSHPVVIWLSSGAGAPSRPRFDPFVQYLVNELHYVVVAPRVRPASPGAGDAGEDAVRDVGSLLVWIGLQSGLDRSRVALLGEGFGAYVALQSLADYGDRLKGAVAAYAPHGSALAHSPAIRRPLLLVQGLDSPGAPPYELEQLRVRLRAEGVDVQTLEAPGEGFGFAHKTYRDAYLASAAGFLDQLLR
jgi:dienelactone hydrolase family protein/WD40 repeat protein